MRRIDHRTAGELRPIRIETGYISTADGAVLVTCGKTRVVCTATFEEKVPPFLTGKGRGWLTAEYAMLPASTGRRKARENYRTGPDGRSVEIQRLIGRSLRAVLDFDALGERTIMVDCDVIEADGGTRTASITGAYVAVALACEAAVWKDVLARSPVKCGVAAVSVGVVGGCALLDLCYAEDAKADVDMNLVMLEDGTFVEMQATGERDSFTKEMFMEMVALGERGITTLLDKQRAALEAHQKGGHP